MTQGDTLVVKSFLLDRTLDHIGLMTVTTVPVIVFAVQTVSVNLVFGL